MYICLFTTKVEHTTARQTDILQIYNKSKPKQKKILFTAQRIALYNAMAITSIRIFI